MISRDRILHKSFLLLAALLSGVLLALAFPTYDLGWVGWVGLVPLLIAISGRSPKYSFFLSFACGLTFFPGVFSWILEISGYTFLHHTILGLYLASYFGLFGLAFTFIAKRFSMNSALFSAPFIWVSLEYIRSNLSFLALPWALLGHSQHTYGHIIQIASITGAYGISFLMVLVNATLTATILAFLYRHKREKSQAFNPPSRKGVISLVIATAVLSCGTLLYGQMTLSKPTVGTRIKMSVVQGNIEQAKKWDSKYENYIMQIYTDLSKKASEGRPALIIWPETATPKYILKKFDILKKMISLIRQTGTYYLIGSAEYPKFKKSLFNPKKGGNTALLFSPKGNVLGQYLKIRLFPFGEYLPYKETIPWSSINVPEVGGYVTGKEFTVFEHPDFRFGVTICWENMFPDLVRQFVKAGAQFMINITNEAWFGKTAAPYQFLSMNVFRAVENRLFVIRCTNTGISCFIDPCGRVLGRVQNNGEDIFVRGYLTKEITISNEKTLYTLYGDWFAYTCMIVSFGFILLVIIRAARGSD
jgi:apolipoprotein N-acyltransferase